jgi:hypothetical protein
MSDSDHFVVPIDFPQRQRQFRPYLTCRACHQYSAHL